ncbi:hypothetical protein [Hymenobacter coalescens]
MSLRLLHACTWLLAAFSSGCVAHIRPDSWGHVHRPLEAERATQPTLQLEVHQKTFPLPLPLVLWEIGSRKYQISLVFTTTLVEHRQVDSIRYQIRTPENQLLAAGTLPFRKGKVRPVPYQQWGPFLLDRYRIRGATPARLPLEKTSQALRGSFLIYAVDRNGQSATLPLHNIPLHYHKGGVIW